LNDLLQSNGYAYAHNNPVTMSDPTGLAISLTASERAAALAGAGLSAAQVAQAQATMGKSLSSVILGAAWSTLKDFIGINDAMACFGGDMWSCAGMVLGAIPWFKAGKIPGVLKAIDRTINAIQAFRKAKKAAEAVLRAAKAAETAALKAKKAAIEKAKKEAAQRAKKKAAEQAKRTSDKAVAQTKKTGNPVQKQAQAKAAPKASSVSKGSGGGSKGGGSKPGGDSGGSSRSKGGSSGSGDSGKADGGDGGSCPVGNSFVPGTKVLMADGTTKPIEEVKAGDKVVATDPETGETRIETVTAEIKGEGLKHLVKVVIDTDGDKGEETAEVTATDGHPFWVPELGEWLDATDLQPGQWLQTSAGTHVQITAIQRWTTPGTTVHNLTVSDTHTYYVQAGTTPVLVHNCGGTEAGARQLMERATQLQSEAGWSGTTAVVRVRNVADPSRVETWVASNKTYMPTGWKKNNSLRPGEIFVQLEGHAEQSIIEALDGKWDIIEGGTSTGVCWSRCTPLLTGQGVTIGGPEFRSSKSNSPRRMFWKP
ncbi:polymorphic toxin-type HINT domain-containing protein, partial [Streptomyces althioticus]|uniref:polymorphic toxin-type HINT domain-containing protein n=7 Tax=Streptomyces althioticus TaxID=83380 RepID=UPI0033CFFF08